MRTGRQRKISDVKYQQKAKRDQRHLEKRVDIDCNEAEVTDILDEIEFIEDNSVVMEDINQNESESEESERDLSAEYKDDAVVRLERVRKRNWIPLSNLAREAERYGLGNRPTADIATAVLT